MRYFIDTEFIEGFHKPLFGKKRHHVELISIGIYAEDNRTYYAISNEFDPNEANDWVKENVLKPMTLEWARSFSGDQRNIHLSQVEGKSLEKVVTMMQAALGKTNTVIAMEIEKFVNEGLDAFIDKYTKHDCWNKVYYPKEFKYMEDHNTFKPGYYYNSGSSNYSHNRSLIYNQPEFYGYFADYDWVVFCSLYGTMMDLPKGFPKYCRDLKQMFDEAVMRQAVKVNAALRTGVNPIPEDKVKTDQKQFEEMIDLYKQSADYPKQVNEHNALADAEWNKRFYDFIKVWKD
jgi:hypothetical protein